MFDAPFLYGAISAVIGSLPTKIFLKELKDNDRKKAIKIIILAWLTLLISFGINYFYKIDLLYFVPFAFSIIYLAFCFWSIRYEKEEKIELKEKIKVGDLVKVIKKSNNN